MLVEEEELQMPPSHPVFNTIHIYIFAMNSRKEFGKVASCYRGKLIFMSGIQ